MTKINNHEEKLPDGNIRVWIDEPLYPDRRPLTLKEQLVRINQRELIRRAIKDMI